MVNALLVIGFPAGISCGTTEVRINGVTLADRPLGATLHWGGPSSQTCVPLGRLLGSACGGSLACARHDLFQDPRRPARGQAARRARRDTPLGCRVRLRRMPSLASASCRGGRRFTSCRPDQMKKPALRRASSFGRDGCPASERPCGGNLWVDQFTHVLAGDPDPHMLMAQRLMREVA